jgi:hypothetical protein
MSWPLKLEGHADAWDAIVRRHSRPLRAALLVHRYSKSDQDPLGATLSFCPLLDAEG